MRIYLRKLRDAPLCFPEPWFGFPTLVRTHAATFHSDVFSRKGCAVLALTSNYYSEVSSLTSIKHILSQSRIETATMLLLSVIDVWRCVDIVRFKYISGAVSEKIPQEKKTRGNCFTSFLFLLTLFYSCSTPCDISLTALTNVTKNFIFAWVC